jgi:hypothetical protein
MTMGEDRTRVYREAEDGNLQRLPIVQTDYAPSAAEVVEGLRSFLRQSQSHDDLVLMRRRQVEALVDTVDSLALMLRGTADRVAGIVAVDAQDAPSGDVEPSGGTESRPEGS